MNPIRLRLGSLAWLLLLALPAGAFQQGLSVQYRQYAAHPEFAERPFDDGNFGYGVAYELRDEMGFWQIGARYTPDAGADEQYDYVVTPFLNIFFRDRLALAGIGILKDYLAETDTTDADWTDLYYNLILGIAVPVGNRLEVQAMAVYDFDDWGRLFKDFAWDEVEFAFSLALLF